jgi:tripartite ATP-independent transporter DctM subunit
MSPEHLGLLLMFAGLIAGVIAGFPLGFLMGGLALIAGYIGKGDIVFYQLILTVGGGVMKSYALSAIPVFMLMGSILSFSGIGEDVYETLDLLFRRVRSGLAIATLILAALISACTGIVGAAVTVTGLIALTPMISRGYSKELSTGIICGGCGMAAKIPPSVLMLIYAPIVGISAVNLFIASLIPGMVLLGLYVLYVIIRSYFEPMDSDQSSSKLNSHSGISVHKILTVLFPTIVIILGVIGSMFFGFARPLEAAGIGALGIFLLAVFHRRISSSNLKITLLYCVKTTSAILFVIVGAGLFSVVFVNLGGDKIARDFILGLSATPSTLIFIMLLVVILVGTFVECVGAILVLTPVYIPIIKSLGFDPVWFGVLFCIALGTAHYTPPVATAVVFLKTVDQHDIPFTTMYKGVVPFMLLQIIIIFIVYFFPQVALWLPAFMAK